MNLSYSIGVALLAVVVLIAVSLALSDDDRPMSRDTFEKNTNDK
ncbi:hypothetical protein [Sulfitobacter mediterraneus]|jgi:predicted histidine transporter YuiF (NhaC family)|nr:hypothetical protein [Sulfitobacter mediterraneus]